jgi:ABC-2 type transport system permease protein
MNARVNARLNAYTWLIRREFWENRAAWILPAVIGGLLLIVAMFGHIESDEIPADMNPDQIRAAGPILFGGVTSVFFIVMSVYSTWYLLDCLYSERKDRSILFWKSLPLSDADTVISKLLVGLIAIPLVYVAIGDLTMLGVAFVLSVRGGSHLAPALWNPAIWLQYQVFSLYAIVTLALWYLPFSGWLLLVSAWGRRAIALWAIFLPLAACFLEIKLLGTNHLGTALKAHLGGFFPAAFFGQDHFTSRLPFGTEHGAAPKSIWEFIDPVGFLTTPETWAAVAIGAAFVYAAIVLRSRATEI